MEMEVNRLLRKIQSRNTEAPVDSNDMMSFSSPAAKPSMLLPQSAVSPNISKFTIGSPSSPLKSPLAASTPFCLTKDAKIDLDESAIEAADSTLLLQTVRDDPFDMVEREAQAMAAPWEDVHSQVTTDPWEQVQVEVERQKCLIEPFHNDDPFDMVERKAQQNADPWEQAEAEAAKFIDNTDGSKSSTLDKAFVVENSSSTPENENKTFTADSPALVLTDKEFDLDNEVPPWGALEDSDDDDLEDLVKRLSDEFPNNFATAELLSEAAICNLGLVSPNPPRFSPIEFNDDLALQSPPLNLNIADMSFGILSGKKVENQEKAKISVTPKKMEIFKEHNINDAAGLKAKFGAIPKNDPTSKLSSRPLGTITNSGIVPRMPLKVVSRLLKPKVYMNKENL